MISATRTFRFKTVATNGPIGITLGTTTFEVSEV